MKLKEARIAAGYQGKQIAIALCKSIDRRIDPALYSKMESGLCLPTPIQFRKICSLLNTEPTTILTPADVDFGLRPARPPRAPGDQLEPDTYKLTVRLPLPLASGLSAKLKRNGYPSITAYICACIRQLN